MTQAGAPTDAPVDAPRPAATVVVARDGVQGRLEVLMAMRNLNSDFVGGAYVFPGGAVDADDGAAGIAARADLTDAEASTRLGVDRGGLAFHVACARELFEEAGLLLAARRDGSRDLGGDLRDRLVEHRGALNAHHRTFLEVLDEEDLSLQLGELAYFAHWITPVGPPRRYDTRFFVAAAPPGQVPLHDDHELVAHTWIGPAEALARHARGEMQLILPTIKNLEALERFDDCGSLLEAVRSPHTVQTIEPRIVRDGEGVRILLPGDPGFASDEADVASRSVERDEIARASREQR